MLAGAGVDGKGAWRDNVFVERLWRSVKYEEVYLRAYDNASEARASVGAISTSTIAAGRIRALTAPHPIKPTSLPLGSLTRQTLHLSTRKICSDNRGHLYI
jgi:hypothetical protein